MSLIKKTVVLTDKTPKGYATFVRVGNESGVKVVGESFTPEMKVYIKIGQGWEVHPLTGKRTEISTNLSLENDSALACMVFSDSVVAIAGKISERDKDNAFSFRSNPDDESIENDKNDEIREPQAIEEEPIIENKGEAQEPQEEKKPSEEEDLIHRLGQGQTDYYVGISDKVDELFVVYPKEEKLTKAIPDSEWVKIQYDGEEYYVVGRLSEENKVRFLGYGVPGLERVKPPKVADGIANWFPLKGLNGYEGYWLFFQDAQTGKIDSE